nr:MAG TPA: hypothetical protein [Bacteriophage sp.]
MCCSTIFLRTNKSYGGCTTLVALLTLYDYNICLDVFIISTHDEIYCVFNY